MIKKNNLIKMNSIFLLFIFLCCVYLLLSFGGCSNKWKDMEFCECKTVDEGKGAHKVVYLKSHDWCRVDMSHDEYKVVAYEFTEWGVVDYDLITELGYTKLAFRPKVNKGSTICILQAERKELVGTFPAAKFVAVGKKYLSVQIDVNSP